MKMPLPTNPPADKQARDDLRAEEHEAKIWLAYYDQHHTPPPPGHAGHGAWKTVGDVADDMEIVGAGLNIQKIATAGIAKKGMEKWVNERKEQIKQKEAYHFRNVLRKEKIEKELKGNGKGVSQQMAMAQLGLGPYPGLGGHGTGSPGTYNQANASFLPQQPLQQSQSQPQAYQQALSQHPPPAVERPYLNQAAPPPPLPEGWMSHPDQTGHIYYIHLATRHTQWEHPGNATPIPQS